MKKPNWWEEKPSKWNKIKWVLIECFVYIILIGSILFVSVVIKL